MHFINHIIVFESLTYLLMPLNGGLLCLMNGEQIFADLNILYT